MSSTHPNWKPVYSIQTQLNIQIILSSCLFAMFFCFFFVNVGDEMKFEN